MPHKVLIVAALSVLSIGSAYALTAAHTFYEPAPDMSFANTTPTLHQSVPDTALEQPRISTSDAAPALLRQANLPLIVGDTPLIIDDAVDTPDLSVAALSALEESPRPIARTPNPDIGSSIDGWLGGTVADSNVTQPLDSNRIATSQKPGTNNLRQANGPWTIGVFR